MNAVTPLSGPVALFVDGDNLSPDHASRIAAFAARQGSADIRRVYGDVTRLGGWRDAPGFRTIQAGCGKNAADVLLCIDAMEVALTGRAATVIVASSDGDFVHLAQRLREGGIHVVGMGTPQAPAAFRDACHRFEVLALEGVAAPARFPVTPLDRDIRAMIGANSIKGRGMPVAALGAQMHKKHGVLLDKLPGGNWRAYLSARPALYDLDPRGPDARVRFRESPFHATA
ncbi:NYN domain-containing protein [Jannaschia rubra]|uniref:NYN domain-containing protein n=1 Tax=Jannaschia rubra TaxID=282197 RepID=UPI002490A97A|nr:NYN domain-containing protein [Jannaschia rubra]